MDYLALIQTIESTFGLGLSIYGTFKQKKAEKFALSIQLSGFDISYHLENNEEFQRYFIQIFDKVLSEANDEKIDKWKNAVIHLATDYKDFDCKDNLVRTLDDLTYFDLTVLYDIYRLGSSMENIINYQKLYEMFESKNISGDFVSQSIKRLSSHGLFDETYMTASQYSVSSMGIKDMYNPLMCKLNDLGKIFLDFIAEM